MKPHRQCMRCNHVSQAVRLCPKCRYPMDGAQVVEVKTTVTAICLDCHQPFERHIAAGRTKRCRPCQAKRKKETDAINYARWSGDHHRKLKTCVCCGGQCYDEICSKCRRKEPTEYYSHDLVRAEPVFYGRAGGWAMSAPGW